MRMTSKKPHQLAVRRKSSINRLLIAVVVLSTVATAIHWSALSGPFIFDDAPAITDNPHITQLWPPGEVVAAPPSGPTEGRPIVSYSFAINYAISGLNPTHYRAVNIAIHVACAIALLLCVMGVLSTPGWPVALRRPRFWIGFAVALVWLAHPLTSEVVNYITQRTESLMALFVLIAFAIWVRQDRSANPLAMQLLAGVCVMLAVLCKETAVVAPLVFLLWDIANRRGDVVSLLRSRAVGYGALLCSWIIVAITLTLGSRADTVGVAHGVGRLDYLYQQASILLEYITLIVWPTNLTIDYGMARPTPFAAAIIPGAAVLLLLAGTISLCIKHPRVGWPLIAAWLLLAPTSSIVPIVSEVGTERRMYLPLACVISVVLPLMYLQFRSQLRDAAKSRKIGAALVVVLTCILAMENRHRSEDYADPLRLWKSATIATPDNPRAWLLYGVQVKNRQGPQEAIEQFEQAVHLDPAWPDAHLALGDALRELEHFEAAMHEYEAAANANPNYPPALRAVATSYNRVGRTDEAISLLRRAADVDPSHVSTREKLGILLLQAGKPNDAQPHLQYLTQQRPDSAEAWNNLASAHVLLGQKEQAIAACNRALAIDPEHRGAKLNLQRMTSEQGDRQ